MHKQHKQVIYTNPDSAYQRFVNAVKLKYPIDSEKELLMRLTNYGKNFKKIQKRFVTSFVL